MREPGGERIDDRARNRSRAGIRGAQALSLHNPDDVSEASRALASRLEAASPDAAERVRLAFRLTLGRRPTAAELEMSRDFLERSPLAELCRALFNANEFVYVD